MTQSNCKHRTKTSHYVIVNTLFLVPPPLPFFHFCVHVTVNLFSFIFKQVSYMILSLHCFMNLEFTHMPGKSYHRQLRSLLCLCDVFPLCVDCSLHHLLTVLSVIYMKMMKVCVCVCVCVCGGVIKSAPPPPSALSPKIGMHRYACIHFCIYFYI